MFILHIISKKNMINLVHETPYNDKIKKSIIKNGLLIPSEINKEIKQEMDELRKTNSPFIGISEYKLKQVQELYDSVRCEHFPVSRANSIYAHVFDKSYKINYEGSSKLNIKINDFSNIFISDQSMNGVMCILRKFDFRMNEECILKLKETAMEYWKEVIPLEKFLKYYSYAPHEESDYNWNCNLHWKECEKLNIPTCFFYPEAMIGKSIIPEKLEFL